jgi:hypothetical protein
MMRSRKFRNFKASVLAVLAVTFLVLLVLAPFMLYYNTKQTVTGVTVTGKERITLNSTEGTSSKYLIFTDQEVFENTDSLLFLKFNSSDVYGKLRPDQVCEFTVVGRRVNFLSWYRNIISATCTEKTS